MISETLAANGITLGNSRVVVLNHEQDPIDQIHRSGHLDKKKEGTSTYQ